MLSVTIIVKNGALHLNRVLTSLSSFDEVILFDTGSTDETLEIAKNYPNVVIYERTFSGFGRAHNEAAALAHHDWILSIDADEIVTQELMEEIKGSKLESDTVYALARRNYFNNKWIRWCGWHPDRVYRLYNRKKTAFSEHLVHEAVITKGMKKISLRGFLDHYPYNSIDDFLIKMERYSTLFAKQWQGKKRSSPLRAFGHGVWAFFRSYVLKRGFLGGYEGYLISAYNGHTAFYKYLKLYHCNVASPFRRKDAKNAKEAQRKTSQ